MRPWLRTLTRLATAAVAAVAAMGPAVSAVLEAKPAAAALYSVASHVEEQGSGHEHGIHIDDCSLCRLVSHGGRTSAPSALPDTTVRAGDAPHGRAETALVSVARSNAPPRGPPTA